MENVTAGTGLNEIFINTLRSFYLKSFMCLLFFVVCKGIRDSQKYQGEDWIHIKLSIYLYATYVGQVLHKMYSKMT